MTKWKKYFFVQLGIICGILFSVFTLNYIVDPFNYNNYFNFGLRKDKISLIMNYRLFKLIKFNNNPKQLIILGDSRGYSLQEEYFKTCGMTIANLAYGGGSLYEAVDTFWEIVKYTDLKAAVFVIPFNIYNDNYRLNLIPEVKNIIENPLSYYLNFFILKATCANIYHKATKRYLRTEKPTISKELFWKHQIGENVTGNFYRSYKYPKILFAEMQRIKQESKKRGIKVLVVLPPTHADLQNKISDYRLDDDYKKYKDNLSSIGLYLDYDTKNSMTLNKNNFLDPYHFNNEIANYIGKDICQKLSE